MLQSQSVEINYHTQRFIFGFIALSLATLTNLLSYEDLKSIRASYHAGGLARDVFVGFLFAISAFFFAYNGYTKTEMVISRIAAVASLGVALFPCGCDAPEAVLVPYVHYVAAAVMFIILAFFCRSFFLRAITKGHIQAIIRAYIYILCGIVIVLSILLLAINAWQSSIFEPKIPNIVFIGEMAALVAFGVAWLTASRILPVITSRDERLSLL